jgi:hypothetical protein
VRDMLVYRAPLQGAVKELLAVTIHPRPNGLRVTIRYVLLGGRVVVHRGRIYVPGAPRRAVVRVAGYQISGGELFLTLVYAPPVIEEIKEDLVLADHFALPFALQAWGVECIALATCSVSVVCRGWGRTLSIAGAATLNLRAPAQMHQLRIPFCRSIPLTQELHHVWHVRTTTTTSEAVEPGGRIVGTVTIAIRCVGRPLRVAADVAGYLDRSEVARVREVLATVARVTAAQAGEGEALVQGALDLDIYWADRDGQSRWTGRSVPFAGVLAVPGQGLDDRLEVQAQVLSLSLSPGLAPDRAAPVGAQILLAVTVTALRTANVLLDGLCYRLQRVVGQACTTLEVVAPFEASRSGSSPVRPAPEGAPLVRGSTPGATEITCAAPGAVRSILALEQRVGQVRALLALTGGGLHLVTAPLPQPATKLLAIASKQGDGWLIRIFSG